MTRPSRWWVFKDVVAGEITRVRKEREDYLYRLALYAFSEARRQARRARLAEDVVVRLTESPHEQPVRTETVRWCPSWKIDGVDYSK